MMATFIHIAIVKQYHISVRQLVLPMYTKIENSNPDTNHVPFWFNLFSSIGEHFPHFPIGCDAIALPIVLSNTHFVKGH